MNDEEVKKETKILLLGLCEAWIQARKTLGQLDPEIKKNATELIEATRTVVSEIGLYKRTVYINDSKSGDDKGKKKLGFTIHTKFKTGKHAGKSMEEWLKEDRQFIEYLSVEADTAHLRNLAKGLLGDHITEVVKEEKKSSEKGRFF